MSDAESSTVTCSGSASSSVVGDASARATGGADHSKRQVQSNLASLLGRKRYEKDVEPSSSKKKTSKCGAGGTRKLEGVRREIDLLTLTVWLYQTFVDVLL